MNDTLEFFAPAPIQPTLYQENVCRPGWVQPMPEPPATPLYTPSPAACSCGNCETCWRDRREYFEFKVAVRRQSRRNHARRLESETPW